MQSGLNDKILLGVNCGFGNTDVASLPIDAVDLDGGWIDFPRPKTEIPRRVPLWPETIEAIREALKQRPQPKEAAENYINIVSNSTESESK